MSPILFGPDAPPARKPWSRKRSAAVGCGGALVVALAGVLGYLGWVNYLPPPEPDPHFLPQPNGYDACIAAAKKVKAAATGPAFGRPRDGDLAALRKGLAAARPALAELRAALALEFRVPPYRSLEAPSPPFALFLQTSRVLVGASRAELNDGKPAAGMRYALDGIELGNRLGRGGLVPTAQTGMSVAYLSLSAAERCIPGLDRAAARDAGQRLDRLLRQLPAASAVLNEERRYTLWLFRALPPERLLEIGAVETATVKEHVSWFAYRFLYPRSATYQTLDRYYRALMAEADRPFSQRVPVPYPEAPYIEAFNPVDDSLLERADLHLARLRLLRLELALHEYRLRKGRFPASLSALDSNPASGLTVDPFTGRPFLYRRRGSGYLLYSTGPDGKDNGGTTALRRGVVAGMSGDLIAGRL